MSVYLSSYLSVYGSTAIVNLGRFFNSLIYTQSAGPLDRGSAIHKAANTVHAAATVICRIGLPYLPVTHISIYKSVFW
jgi:hypothetical protein